MKQLKTPDRKIGGFVFWAYIMPVSVKKIPGGGTVRDELFEFGELRDLPAVCSPALLESGLVNDFSPNESATDAFSAY